MLSRIQIRAEADTAHSVEGEMLWAAQRLTEALGFTAELVDQVIEGTPGKKFSGRLTLTVTGQAASVAEVA
jgi:hypothetical protein